MTCVVALRAADGTIHLGADSAATSYGGNQTIVADEKIFANGPLLFGVCGSFRVMQLLRYALRVPEHPRRIEGDRIVADTPMAYMTATLMPAVRTLLREQGALEQARGADLGGHFLAVYRGRIYTAQQDFSIVEARDGYDACGCGADLALGSLYATWEWTDARYRVQKALEAAVQHNAFCRAPFAFLAHPPSPEESGPR